MIELFSDGSCSFKSEQGAWAFVAKYKERIECRYGYLPKTTTNEAELTAIYRALLFLRTGEIPVRVVTDSTYCKNAVNKWWRGWEVCGWVTSIGSPVKNVKMIRAILALLERHRESRIVEVHWVKGHSGECLNERADELASKSRREKLTHEAGCVAP